MSRKLIKSLKENLKNLDKIDIVDILVFGSAVKGKEFPNDIDICIVFREKIIKEKILDVENRLKKFNIHITSLVIDNFFKKPPSLVKTLLVEGISILNEKPLINNFDFSSYSVYSYNLSNIKQSEKVKFVYLLKGRKDKGIIEKLGGEWLADSCFLIPIDKDREILEIFKKWQVPYKKKEALIH